MLIDNKRLKDILSYSRTLAEQEINYCKIPKEEVCFRCKNTSQFIEDINKLIVEIDNDNGWTQTIRRIRKK